VARTGIALLWLTLAVVGPAHAASWKGTLTLASGPVLKLTLGHFHTEHIPGLSLLRVARVQCRGDGCFAGRGLVLYDVTGQAISFRFADAGSSAPAVDCEAVDDVGGKLGCHIATPVECSSESPVPEPAFDTGTLQLRRLTPGCQRTH
jgi:hypothetical protein